ncbi:MAG: MATE family efflux transporter [Lachnospiraceae bacterium]|nr:MATE family efflux transporter [Lachnospiraceae bacterium]
MSNQKAGDMTKGNPMKLLILFSLPVLLGNVFQQLYNMVDTIIVGKYLGYQSLAAVGTTGSLNFLVLGFANGLTSGFSVLVAQRFGAKDEEGMKKAEASAVSLCVGFTVLLTVLSLVTTKPLLRLINTPDDILGDAALYISIIYAGIAATMMYNLLACFLRAIGDSKTPLYFLIVSSLLNIVLDIWFIRSFGMGVEGAALATVISQGISGVLCLLWIWKKYPILHLSRKDFKVPVSLYKRHLNIGLPMAFQFSITAIGTVVVQGTLNTFGTAKIAAFTAACKAEQLVTQPAVTFGVTMANYGGQNLGAGRTDRIKEGVAKCTILTLCCAVFSMGILFLFGEPLTKLFMSGDEDPAVVEEILAAAQLYLRQAALFFPFLNMIFVYRNVLQGIGRSFMPLMAGVFELVTRCLSCIFLPALIGYQSICLAGPLAWVAAAVPLGIAYYYLRKRNFFLPETVN